MRIKHYIEHHFGLVLILSCMAGLFLPGLPLLPNETAVLILALLMFTACYKLGEGGIRTVSFRGIGLFYVVRYIALPLLLWTITNAVLPDYAVAVFLLSVVPSAVSAPAFSHMFGGVVAPAFTISIMSQMLAPIMIPALFFLIGNTGITPSPGPLFLTMVWCIFIPVVVYALVRRQPRLTYVMQHYNKMFSIILVAMVIALAVSKQRDIILTGGAELWISLALTLCAFAVYIVVGWFVVPGATRPERITYAVSSGFNNAALGVSLALLHFPPPVLLFVAVSEIAWAFLPTMMRFFLRLFNR